jgi:1D-myo-inositol-triphosphate 3-kinase
MSSVRKELSIVAAGHASQGGSAIRYHDNGDCSGKPRTILKALEEEELAVYLSLEQHFPTDPVKAYIPKFEGVVVDSDETGQVSTYLCIENLLRDFDQPKVMDVKLGIRTFAESECTNAAPRSDLYKRMVGMYPGELNPDDHAAQAVTKYRWMTVRDAQSTTSGLGYRIDGIAGYHHKSSDDVVAKLQSVRTADEAHDILQEFVESAANTNGARNDNQDTALLIAKRLKEKLGCMLDAVRSSDFVRSYEFVGSSVLLIADARGQTGVYWIDFAKSQKLPLGTVVTHSASWAFGNHEDGILTGICNLRDLTTYTQVRLNLRRSSFADDNTSQSRLAARAGGTPQQGSKSETISDVALLESLPSFRPIQNPQNLYAPILRATESLVGASAAVVLGAATGAATRGAAVASAAAIGVTTAGVAAVDAATTAVDTLAIMVKEPVINSRRWSRRTWLWTCGSAERATDKSPTRSAMLVW